MTWPMTAHPSVCTLLNGAPSATQYYSDQLAAYADLVYYPGHHGALPDKRQTYSVDKWNQSGSS